MFAWHEIRVGVGVDGHGDLESLLFREMRVVDLRGTLTRLLVMIWVS